MASTSLAVPSTRWRRRKDARPGEIVAAGLACFAERGFAATRLEDVASRAGITKGTLYLYFPNGLGRSKLAAVLARPKGGAMGTTRNWRTVMKVLEMAEAL